VVNTRDQARALVVSSGDFALGLYPSAEKRGEVLFVSALAMLEERCWKAPRPSLNPERHGGLEMSALAMLEGERGQVSVLSAPVILKPKTLLAPAPRCGELTDVSLPPPPTMLPRGEDLTDVSPPLPAPVIL
jgi:hypothetical protein